jgi:two-component system sensor histidine kinase DegS
VKTRSYTSRTSTQPTRLIKDGDDLEAQFDAIVDALRRDVRRMRQQVDKYARAYQRTAEAESRRAEQGKPEDESTQKAYRRLKQLQLAVQHIESSAAYLLGSGIEPEIAGDHGESLEVAQRVLESLELEYQRLYRDVHDGPAQVLANAIFEIEYLERIAERAPSEVRQTLRTELSNLKGQFRTSLDSVRAMIYDLRPPELTELGLAEAIGNYAAEWEARCGIRVASRLDTMDTGLQPMQELAVYRVMQEALQNVHKHAQANTVGLAWQRTNDSWVLHVTDDGVGFDPELMASATGLGVKGSIVGRMKRVGGHASLEGAPGGGTLVTLITSRQGA